MIKVKRLGHATISTPDIEAQTDYYGRLLGLSIIDTTKDRVFLGSKQGLEAIELVRGRAEWPQAAVVPDRARHRPQRRRQAARQDGLQGRAAQGHLARGRRSGDASTTRRARRVDLYAEYNFAKRDDTPNLFNILKLGHVAYRVLDVQKVVKFYTEVLGFRVSDWRGDFFVFMRCNTDHHTLNFIIDEKPQLHHIAFEVVDWAEINKAVDYLAHNKVHLVWGPGRHVIGHNVATYHRNATWCGSKSSPRWTR